MTKLTKTEQLVVSILDTSPLKTASSITLREGGIYSVSQTVGRLRDKGAIISVVRKATYDNKTGELHNNIAHYCLEGWCNHE